MGDSIQTQLDKLFQLLLSEQLANQARQEKVDLLHAKLDALSLDLEATKRGSPTAGSQQRGNKDKGAAGGFSSGTSMGNSFVPKFTKLDFPKFNGTDDPIGWLNRCEHFFKHQATLEAEKVSLASYHLEGMAQLWFMQLVEDMPNPTWEDFSQQCNLRFGPPIRSNKLGELAKLQQRGSVTEYQTQFEALISRAGSLTQFQKVQFYLSGLQDAIAVEVELHQPQDLATAMSMSCLYERKLFPKLATIRDSMETPAMGEYRTHCSIKRLSKEEMDERRKRGLCFNCDEIFVRGHQCKKLFWIEFVDKGANEASNFDAKEEETNPTITSFGA